jgi:hypothetical protein
MYSLIKLNMYIKIKHRKKHDEGPFGRHCMKVDIWIYICVYTCMCSANILYSFMTYYWEIHDGFNKWSSYCLLFWSTCIHTSFFSWVQVVPSFVLCVVFSRSLFAILSHFFATETASKAKMNYFVQVKYKINL